jgi:uncharacterized membrane protein YcaP (DUF421 family)
MNSRNKSLGSEIVEGLDSGLWLVVARTIGTYVVIFFIFRVMGKREIGEVGVLDLVIFVMLAEMAVISIESPEKGFIKSLIPMFVLLAVQRFTSYLSLKSIKMREFLDGKASIIIRNGKIDEKEMKRQRYNINDLLEQLHSKGIQLIQDVELAILEPTGKLSIFEKKNHPMEIYEPLVIDGIIQQETLQKIEKDEVWLKGELKKLGNVDLKKVSYCSLNRDGTLYVDVSNVFEKEDE